MRREIIADAHHGVRPVNVSAASSKTLTNSR